MDGTEKTSSLEAIVASFLEAQARGESVDAGSLLNQHPDQRDELADCLRKVMAIDDCFRRLREEPPPPNIPGYRIVRKIGEGGMSTVYLAEQTSLKRSIALKVMSPAWAGDQRTVARFQREAETIARLAHPGIVPIHEFGESAGRHFLALEYVPGITLADLIASLKRTGIPTNGLTALDVVMRLAPDAKATAETHGGWERPYPRLCAALLRDVAQALDFAHRKGVVHRDVKPSNIVVSAEARPRLIDFGLTLPQQADALTRSTDFLGTALYASPEQASGSAHSLGPQSDVFSLGVVMYELLALQRPFEGRSVAEVLEALVGGEPVPLRRLNPEVPRDLETICLVALEKDLRHRYASAKDLADDLQRFLDEKPILARPASAMRRLGRVARRNPASVGLALAALLLISGLSLRLTRARSSADATARELEAAHARLRQSRANGDETLRLERYLRAVAEGRLSEAMALLPGRPEAYLARARSATDSKKDLTRALADVDKTLALQGPTRESLTLKASLLQRLGSQQESIRVEQEIMHSFPTDKDAPVRLSYKLMAAGDHRQAADLAEIMIRARPSDPRLRKAAAWANLELNALDKSLEHAGKAIELAPTDPEARHVLAQALLQEKRYDEASKAFSQLVRLAPTDVRARSAYAGAMALAGDLSGAERQYRLCLEESPDDVGALQGLAANLAHQGKPVEALALYKQSLKAGGDDALTYLQVAELLESLDRADEAATYRAEAAKTTKP